MIARLLPVALLCCALVTPAHSDEWRSNDASEFHFEATIERVATPGEFRRFVVEFHFDAARPDDGRLEVNVDLGAADMGDPDMNAVLYDSAWFDTANFATAVFTSEDIVLQAPGEFVARGELDLKGRRVPVDVPFRWTESGDTAGMQGTLQLDRRDFDVGSGEWSSDETIGVQVKLSFAVQLERQPQ